MFKWQDKDWYWHKLDSYLARPELTQQAALIQIVKPSIMVYSIFVHFVNQMKEYLHRGLPSVTLPDNEVRDLYRPALANCGFCYLAVLMMRGSGTVDVSVAKSSTASNAVAAKWKRVL
ncbi:hypothetical protein N7465_009453 [Penicillium sp. CMV-2018d]|nr:hypothetical protein N7465_009453 [Penicillium sp. CMV-2018d]